MSKRKIKSFARKNPPGKVEAVISRVGVPKTQSDPRRSRPEVTRVGVKTFHVRGVEHFRALMEANPARLVEMTQQGLNTITAVVLAEKLHIPTAHLAPWLGLSRATFDRKVKRQQDLGLVESDRVVRYTQLWRQAVDLWGSEEAAQQWLTSPEPALNGQTPIARAITGVGSREVEDLMGRIAYGIAT